ncbi:MAG TPA: hypothetical protein VFD33_00805 [Bacillota bacterium]|nr:hypothetical protein [Bacillota bacterium]
MNNIYVVLSATPTKIGLTIRALTRSGFNHVSISLNKDLSQMYSFARYRAHNALVGGFIKESPQRLTLGKDKSVQIKVYKIPLSDENYYRVQAFVYGIMESKETYIYNSLAVLGRPLGMGSDTYRAFVCTDFVINSLIQGGLEFNSTSLTPGQIGEALSPYLFYTGPLESYCTMYEADRHIEEFFKRYPLHSEIGQVAHHFYSLIKRNYRGQRA